MTKTTNISLVSFAAIFRSHRVHGYRSRRGLDFIDIEVEGGGEEPRLLAVFTEPGWAH